MIILLRDDPMNVAGEIGGSGIRMARLFSRGDLGSQTLIPKFKARAAYEFSGQVGQDREKLTLRPGSRP